MTNYKKEEDMAFLLQEVAKGNAKITNLPPHKQNMLEEFEKSMWDFDIEEFDHMYQVYLDREVTVNRSGRVRKVQGNYTIKFVAWKEDNDQELKDEYPEMVRALKYDGHKLMELRDLFEEQLGYEPDTGV